MSVKREIPLLYHSIRIECPQYDGLTVSPAIVKKLEDSQVFIAVSMLRQRNMKTD